MNFATGWTDPETPTWKAANDGGDVALYPSLPRSGVFGYTWSVTFTGAVIQAGRFTLTVNVPARRRIYKGTDDFQNICKNTRQTIWSLNGRLYCWAPQVVTYRFSP